MTERIDLSQQIAAQAQKEIAKQQTRPLERRPRPEVPKYVGEVALLEA